MNTGRARIRHTRNLLALAFLLPLTALGQDSSTLGAITSDERAALNPPPELLAKGRSVADAACKACHGRDGLSRTPGTPNLAGQRTIYLSRTLQAMADERRREKEMAHAVDTLNRNTLLALAAHYAN